MKYKSTKLVEVLTIIALICCFGLSIFLDNYYSANMPVKYQNWSFVADAEETIRIINIVISAITLIIGLINVYDKKDVQANIINSILVTATILWNICEMFLVDLRPWSNFSIASFHTDEVFKWTIISIIIFKIVEYIGLITCKTEERKKAYNKIFKYTIIGSFVIIILIIILSGIYKKITIKRIQYDSYESHSSIPEIYEIRISLQKITSEEELDRIFKPLQSNDYSGYKEYFNNKDTAITSETKEFLKENNEKWAEMKKELENKFVIDDEFWNNNFLLCAATPYWSDHKIDYIEYDKKERKISVIYGATDKSGDTIFFIKLDKKYETENLELINRYKTEPNTWPVISTWIFIGIVVISIFIVKKILKIEDRFIMVICIIVAIIFEIIVLLLISWLGDYILLSEL